jgi:hypothetical protein
MDAKVPLKERDPAKYAELCAKLQKAREAYKAKREAARSPEASVPEVPVPAPEVTPEVSQPVQNVQNVQNVRMFPMFRLCNRYPYSR